MSKLDDKDIMAFGKYRGSRLEDIPASYLLWLYDNPTGLWCDNINPGEFRSQLKEYIEENWPSLEQDAPDYLAKHAPSR